MIDAACGGPGTFPGPLCLVYRPCEEIVMSQVNVLIEAVWLSGDVRAATVALHSYLREHPEECPACAGTKRVYKLCGDFATKDLNTAKECHVCVPRYSQ